MGLQFGYLLGGSILVETVFTWPGSGFLLSKAIINRDVPVLQGTILVLSLVFVATNLVVDLLQSLIDPRIRRAWGTGSALQLPSFRSGPPLRKHGVESRR